MKTVIVTHNEEGGGGGGKRGLITSYESNIYVFTLAQIKVVQNVKNVTLVPFCKTECFDYILAS